MNITGEYQDKIDIKIVRVLITLFMVFIINTTLVAQITLEDVILRIGRFHAVLTNDMAVSAIQEPGWTLHPGEGFVEKSIAHLDNISIDYNMCQNFIDPDNVVWDNVTVIPWQEGSRTIKFPLKLSDGKYIHNYVRYPQTEVTVNGVKTSSSEPRGELNPAAIDALGSNCDQYIENKVLTNVGLEFTRKVYAWAHHQDNNYVIVEMIIKNIGVGWGPNQELLLNTDTFKFEIDTVKLPVQTIHGFLYGIPKVRALRNLGGKTINKRSWLVHYGFRKGDTLRMLYAYDGQIIGKPFDTVGEPATGEDGRLQNYMGRYVAVLHAPKSVEDRSDDITQPRYTGYNQNWNIGLPKIWDKNDKAKSEEKGLKMRNFIVDPLTGDGPYYEGDDIYPGLHQVNMDERGFWSPDEVPGYYPWARSHAGPYEIPPGDSIKFIMAMGTAGLSPKVAFRVGRDWAKGICKFDGENSSPIQRPSHIDDNDWAKDLWTYTVIDSMKNSASRAKWNAKNKMNIPVPPPPLKWLKIQETIGAIKLSWSNNAESASNFEGYRIYRAQGASDSTLYNLVYELSKTKGNLATELYDTQIERGPDYYYYVTTFSISDGPNAYKKGEVLESGRNYIQAFSPARFVPSEGLTEGHWQDSVRVVPNPFNLSAREVQFNNTPNKLLFVNLPPICTIRIYSENGNLIKTIEHIDGKSDEQWEDAGQYLLTESGQRVVSAIYIAHFQTPSGESQFRKFVIVR